MADRNLVMIVVCRCRGKMLKCLTHVFHSVSNVNRASVLTTFRKRQAFFYCRQKLFNVASTPLFSSLLEFGTQLQLTGSIRFKLSLTAFQLSFCSV